LRINQETANSFAKTTIDTCELVTYGHVLAIYFQVFNDLIRVNKSITVNKNFLEIGKDVVENFNCIWWKFECLL